MSPLCPQSAGSPHYPLGVWGYAGKADFARDPLHPSFSKPLRHWYRPLSTWCARPRVLTARVRLLQAPMKRTPSAPVSLAFAPSRQAPLEGRGALSKNHRTGVLSPEGGLLPPSPWPSQAPGLPNLVPSPFF